VIGDLATAGCVEPILLNVIELDLVEVHDGFHHMILQRLRDGGITLGR
jgi:hypothetical protein